MRTEGAGETTTRATPSSHAGESGQVNRIVAEEVECANEQNVSHLQILLIETLYYELYYYGH